MARMPDPRITVAIAPAGALTARPRLVAALEAAFPVRFTEVGAGGAEPAALVLVDADPASAVAPVGATGLRTLVVGDSTAADASFSEVTLAADAPVDRRVQDVTLRDRLLGGPLAGDGAVLAAAGATAVWRRDDGAVAIDRVRCALPELEPGQVLYALLSQRAIATVALIHFLREVCAPVAWTAPPLRAALVFDDPNLRWRRYGFVDYPALVAHADEHGYHAAMAMIPLDATRAHRPTAALFARRADRLSLVVHGNDHLRKELLGPQDDATALALAAQAVRRIERFERRTGLAVQRIMMPPHGLCSEHTARALSAVGFEALSAIHPAPWTEERPAAPELVAWNPAEFIGGCAVIPRDALTSTVADLALRAFLDHALIVYAHHDDVAGGLEPLAEAAARVNRLGDVRWTSVGEIARSNAVARVDAGRLVVRPFSRRVDVDVPADATTLTVAAPSPIGGALELRGWSIDGGTVQSFDAPLEVEPGRAQIRLHGTRDVDPHTVAAPAWRPWPRLRRAGTELRDRAVAFGRT
jgi:hypothetical protein